MKIFKKMKKGFTLVELVVVIAVIAILAAVSVGAYFGVTESANRSKLEQEGKQVQTAIQTISLAGKEHSSLDNTGLTIKAPGAFELALEESLGKEVALTDVQNTKDPTNPTICFYAETAVSNEINSNTKYTFFEYHIPGINNKKAAVSLVTGEVNVVDTTVTEEDIKPQPIEITLAEANEIGESYESEKFSDPQEYIIEGVITSISSQSLGSMYITDGETEFFVYSIFKDKTKFGDLAEKPDLGDTVRLCGIIGKYEDTAEMKNAQLMSFIPGDVVIPDPLTITIAEANTIASSYKNNQYSDPQEYIIEGVVESVSNLQFGNLTITDGEASLYIYGIYQGEIRYDALSEKPNEGDTVTLRGVIGKYDDTVQMKNAQLVSFVEGSQNLPVDPYKVTLTFDDVAKRTELTDTRQVWSENDLTVTNNKAGYQNNIANYSSPARFYQNTEIVISYVKNIVNIEFNFVDNSDYDGDLIKILTTGEVEGTTFKYTLETPCIEFRFINSEEQLRLNSLTITFNDDPINEPTVAPHDHDWNNDGTCKVEGCDATCEHNWTSKSGKCDVCNYQCDHTLEEGDTCTTCGYTQPTIAEGEQTAYVSIQEYAESNTWVNSTKYPTINIDNVVSANATGTDNTGKYYTNGHEWRTYQTENPIITISAENGYSIISVKVTYNTKNGGTLTLNNKNVSTETLVNIYAESVTFGVGNTGTDTNGQANITRIDVVYIATSELEIPSHTHEWNNDGTCKDFACSSTCPHNWNSTEGVCTTCGFVCQHTLNNNICTICGYEAPSQPETPEVTKTTSTINQTFTGVTGTSYTDFSNKKDSNNIVFGGKVAGGNSSVQLRSNGGDVGIVVTANDTGFKGTKITIEWHSETLDGRTLNVYGKATAYTSAADLYVSSTGTSGTKIGTIVKGTSTELALGGTYAYIGFRSNSDAMYIKTITIEWSK